MSSSSSYMSNFKLCLHGCSQEDLGKGLSFVLKSVLAWKEVKDGLYLALWEHEHQIQEKEGVTKFPVALPLDQATVMVYSWLAAKKPVEPECSGPDGSESKGFELIAERMKWSDPPCLVRPIWAWHAK